MMRLGFNLLLALAWCLLNGAFTPWLFVAGLVIGALIIAAYGQVSGARPYLGRVVNLARFTGYFAWILVKSNLAIARELITPGWSQTPRFIRYPVGDLTDAQRAVLANSITLTPGTLTVDVCPEGRYLYLHCMYAKDREAQLAEIDLLLDRLKRWVFAC
jgi:multicomponent Na+:H+ antiporter subunit E